MRCPSCTASNPDDAGWCGQCFVGLNQPEPERPAPVAPASPVVSLPAEPAGNAIQTPSATSVEQLRTPGMRRSGKQVEWECAQCGEYHSMDNLRCDVCGASFADRYRTVEAEAPQPNWALALMLSAVAPGAGHVLLGRYGAGLGRLLLFTVWLLGAFALFNATGSGAALVAAPLLVGVAALWVTGLVDIQRLRQGRPSLLSNRALLWLVVGVVGLSLLALFAAFIRIAR